MLPALDRMPGIWRLVDREQYFVIHAPRQTGKTTALKALAREINDKGEMIALYCTLETLQNATDPARAATAIAGLLQSNAEKVFPQYFEPRDGNGRVCEAAAPYAPETIAVTLVLVTSLTFWARTLPKP